MRILKPAKRNPKRLRKILEQETRTTLKSHCQELKFKNFQNKSKDDLVNLLLTKPIELDKLIQKGWWDKYQKHIAIVSLIIGIAGFFGWDVLKEAYNNLTAKDNEVITNNASSEKFSFLMFPSKDSFKQWTTDYNFKSGFPKHARSIDTDTINKDFIFTGIKDGFKHPYVNDKRIIVSLDTEIIDSLITDSTYQNKHKFIPISHRQAENMGFISDFIEQRKIYLVEKELNIVDAKVDSLFRPIFKSRLTGKNYYSGFNGLMVNMIIQTDLGKERRNEYLFDYGNHKSRNRLSVYFNEDNYLCLRIIDDNSDVFILMATGNFDERVLFLNLGFNWTDNSLSIRLNDSILLEHAFDNEIDFVQDKSSKGVLGNSIDHYYGCRFSLRYIKLDIVHNIALNGSKLINTWFEVDMNENDVFVDDKMNIAGFSNESPSFSFK
jgi:hypothetical protein